MTHRATAIFILALSLLRSAAHAQDEAKMANIVFPSENQIITSQLTPVTEKELKEIQKSIELPSDECLNPFKKTEFDDQDRADLLGRVTKIDFSGDGKDDLIFSTYCRSEEVRNYFWVREDNRYKYSELMIGTIIKLFRTQDSKALSVVTRGGWCCMGQIGFINLYTPVTDNQTVKYKLGKSVSEFGRMTVPDKRMPVKKFIVINDKYKLRESPFINDTYNVEDSDFEHMPVYGNTLAMYSKGSKGVAIAEQSDETGRIWWFVIMNEDAKTTYSRFYKDDTDSKMGWMSSRFLEVIK